MTNTLIVKLVQIQKELKAPKNQYSKFGNYYYRSCEDILEAVKPIANSKDCVILLSDDVQSIGSELYVKSTVKITDGKDTIEASAFARETMTRPKFDSSQLTGSASSYARKYALNGLFCIDDTKDVDTDENKNEANNRANQQDNNKTTTSQPELAPEQKVNLFCDSQKAKLNKCQSLEEVEVLRKTSQGKLINFPDKMEELNSLINAKTDEFNQKPDFTKEIASAKNFIDSRTSDKDVAEYINNDSSLKKIRGQDKTAYDEIRLHAEKKRSELNQIPF